MRALLLGLLCLASRSGAADMERPPAAAGRFYPADASALLAQVDRLLAKGRPGAVSGKVIGLLVPHAGMEYSGEAAATAFNAVDPDDVDTVLMVGAAHFTSVEGAALFPGAYATPLGRLEYDRTLGTVLLGNGDFVKAMPEAHDREHSIEVNAPFLQRRFPKAKLVALVMNAEDLATAERLGALLARAVKGRRVLLVASSDLSHYPPGRVADLVDPTTLYAMGSMDPAFFYSVNRFLMSRGLPELKCTYCGEGAATAVLAAARELGATEAKVLARYNSGDALSEHVYRAVVGYAAVAFVKGSEEPRAPYGLSMEDKALLLREARASLARGLAGGAERAVELSSSPALNLPAAVFVTLESSAGLRGCIGDLEPRETLLEAVRRFAVEAGLHDSRFAPVSEAELSGLKFEVSILTPARAVASAADVRPKTDGVVVRNGERRGVFLPQVWQTLPDKDAFLAELCREKAGLPPDCAKDPKTKLSVFGVETFRD